MKRSPQEFQRQTRLSSGAVAEADEFEFVVAAVDGAGVLPFELELDDCTLESWLEAIADFAWCV